MSRTHAQLMARLDPLDPASIDHLIAYHRAMFGDAVMRANEPAGASAGEVRPEPDPDAGDGQSTDAGFPAQTPLAEMTVEQREAYWKHQARKHETAYKALGDVNELRAKAAETDRLRQEHMTAEERAITAAREEGRQAALNEVRPRLVESAFRAVAERRQLRQEQTDILWAGVNPAAFLTEAGEVDMAKVSAHLGVISPAEDSHAGLFNTGGGRHEPIKQTGREAGLAEAQRRFGTKS